MNKYAFIGCLLAIIGAGMVICNPEKSEIIETEEERVRRKKIEDFVNTYLK